jgi:hypothetical protein
MDDAAKSNKSKTQKSRARNRFTAVAVRNLNEVGYHHDGGGLYLQVSPTKTKSWVLRCRVPCDHVPVRSWPLFRARQLMRGVIASLQGEKTS